MRRDADGNVEHAETDRSRFSSSKDVSFVPLGSERVVEVAFDQLEGDRFRHAVQLVRWRPDKDPADCTLDQVDRATAYGVQQIADGTGTFSQEFGTADQLCGQAQARRGEEPDEVRTPWSYVTCVDKE